MRLKVLQWNVWYKENPDNILHTVQKIDPDIFCAQELTIDPHENGTDIPKYLAERLKYHYFFAEAHRGKKGIGMKIQGNGIFSKSPLLEKGSSFLRENKDAQDPTKEPRLYQEATININGNTLTIGTTHLSYIKYFRVNQDRKKEVDKLVSIIKNKRNSFIFTGDLNSRPNSYTVKQLRKYLKHCGPNFQEKTWTTKPFEYKGFYEDKLRYRLDYVFATHDMKVISSKITDTSYSDHLPILVEFEI